jgi:hypothetical protein
MSYNPFDPKPALGKKMRIFYSCISMATATISSGERTHICNLKCPVDGRRGVLSLSMVIIQS